MAKPYEPHPISQFDLKKLVDIQAFGLDLSFTNSSLYMLIIVGLTTLFLTASMSGRAIVPGRMQSLAEMSYELVAGMIRSTAGSEGLKYFPLIFSLFFFILFANLIGMFPYAFTVTSHIIVNFVLALIVILAVVGIGLARHGLGFLRLFAPSGIPLWLMPLMIVIEVISFLIRPVTLSVRLFANMLAGHIMLKVFGAFVVMLSGIGAVGILAAIIPFLGTIAVTGLEFIVAFLQAYIFAILSCIYLNDALHPSH